MLFNPKWSKPKDLTLNDISLLSLIKWLETQPPEKIYDFASAHTCLVAQYLQAQGFSVTQSTISTLDYRLASIANGPGKDQTFGAALERARAILLKLLDDTETQRLVEQWGTSR